MRKSWPLQCVRRRLRSEWHDDRAAAGQLPLTDQILDILKNAKTIAVVGISSKPFERVLTSNIWRWLHDHSVNPQETEVHSLKCYAAEDARKR
jgi:hypothetical protein